MTQATTYRNTINDQCRAQMGMIIFYGAVHQAFAH